MLLLPHRGPTIPSETHISRQLGTKSAMYGDGPRRSRVRWPRSRQLGCLLWLLILVVVLVILSVMFGGFQKGSKVNGLPPGHVTVGLYHSSPP